MLLGAAIFARPLCVATLVAALAGGLAPDLPMFAMVLCSTRVSGIPEHEVFSTLFFSESWQAVFAVDHSFFVWGSLLGLALWRRRLILRAFEISPKVGDAGSGGVLKLAQAVAELNPLDDLGQPVPAIELAPFALRGDHQLERHGEAGLAA